MKVDQTQLFRPEVMTRSFWALRCLSGEIVEIACHDDYACGVEGKDYVCSRLKGHVGGHVACAFEERDSSRPEEILEEWTS
jgi:hypothetical protein